MHSTMRSMQNYSAYYTYASTGELQIKIHKITIVLHYATYVDFTFRFLL